MANTSFVSRTVFPTLDSLPRSYFLGHHAAGLAKMRTMLSQIDLVIDCRDYRVPFTSRNPMLEEVWGEKEKIIVYTKEDLASSGNQEEDEKLQQMLRRHHSPHHVRTLNVKSEAGVRSVLRLVKKQCDLRQNLAGSHCLVVGMPNVGKSTLLNALRHHGMHKGKVSTTGAQPGVTRKIGTAVKISDGSESGAPMVYVLDTPGVSLPYIPDAEAMLKLALCGSVKDNIVAPFTLADYLLFHINKHDPNIYSDYHPPTNRIIQVLKAMAAKTGRLQKGGTPDIDGTALWMVQRWRNGYLGRFMLDDVNTDAIEREVANDKNQKMSLNQARKAVKKDAKAKSALAAKRAKQNA